MSVQELELTCPFIVIILMLFITECKEEMLEEKSTFECFNYTYRSLSHICDPFHFSVFDLFIYF